MNPLVYGVLPAGSCLHLTLLPMARGGQQVLLWARMGPGQLWSALKAPRQRNTAIPSTLTMTLWAEHPRLGQSLPPQLQQSWGKMLSWVCSLGLSVHEARFQTGGRGLAVLLTWTPELGSRRGKGQRGFPSHFLPTPHPASGVQLTRTRKSGSSRP